MDRHSNGRCAPIDRHCRGAGTVPRDAAASWCSWPSAISAYDVAMQPMTDTSAPPGPAPPTLFPNMTSVLRLRLLLYERLNRDFDITHFYLNAPDRVNILRLHALGRAGDRIERVTTLTAERDDDTAFGVEMGPLGTFTLRLVRPWHDRGSGALIGFFNWHVGRIGRRIERDQRAMKELATRDGLTGLYNHRTFHLLLQDEIARAERYGEGLALLMIDIDHFKRVNDAHGHQAGDAVLTGLGERLEAQLRKVDRVCRYGGEEIAVILPSTAAATQTAERLRSVVAAAPFAVADGKTVPITLSIGVATYPTDGAGIDKLVSAADNALYAAKAGGRNRVCASVA